MNQEALLFSVLKLEEHILLADMESDFSSPDVDPCHGGPHEWSPKNEVDSKVALYIHYHEVAKDEGVSHSHQDVFDYPFRISNHRICELHSHVCWGKSRVLKFFINYRGHDVDARPQIAKAVLVLFVIDRVADHGDPWILLHCCHQAIPRIVLWENVPTCMFSVC